MPLLILLLLVLLIAQIGFWDTLGAILGAVGMVVLLIVLAGAALALGVRYYWRRLR